MGSHWTGGRYECRRNGVVLLDVDGTLQIRAWARVRAMMMLGQVRLAYFTACPRSAARTALRM